MSDLKEQLKNKRPSSVKYGWIECKFRVRLRKKWRKYWIVSNWAKLSIYRKKPSKNPTDPRSREHLALACLLDDIKHIEKYTSSM